MSMFWAAISEPEVVHPSALADADAAAWRGLAAQTPAFGNPLLGPDFARAVGAVRADAEVAIWRHRGEAVAFLPYHRRPSGFARPIGAPFADYQALVSGPDFRLDVAQALRDLGLSAMRLSGLVDPFGQFNEALQSRPETSGEAPAQGRRVVLDGGSGDFLTQLGQAHGNALKNYRRYGRRLACDFGELRIVAADHSQEAFDRLLGWKTAQLHRTGLHDFTRPDWTRTLLQRLFESREGGFSGLMISLYAGKRHVAGHFGVRLDGWYHPWIGAIDSELSAYSPGFLHQWKAIEAMPALGLSTYDLGPGDHAWKRTFASQTAPVSEGLVWAPSLAGRLARSREQVWRLPGLDRIGAVGRLRRRLDQIAVMELTVEGRVRGVVDAFTSLERRNAERRHET